MMTSAVHISIQVTSPLLGGGAGVAAVGPAGAGPGAVAAGLSGAARGFACASAAAANANEVTSATNANSFFVCISLERLRIGLAGADADDFLELEHEDLAVADLAG